MVPDKTLQNDVLAQLKFEPSVNAAHIGVTAKEGVVTLTGNVSSFEQKLAAERALKIISWDLHLPASSIYVKVDHGIVTLQGTVEEHFQRSEAERQVRKLSGVVGMINEIRLKPKPTPPDIRERLEAAMHRNAEIGRCSIGVYQDNGRVTLTGTVDNWHQREVAEHIAWLTPGVTAVDDRIALH